MRRMYLDVPLWVQCDFDGCRQHLWIPLSAAHAAHAHLCGVDGRVQVLRWSEARHLQPLWERGVFHHSCIARGEKNKYDEPEHISSFLINPLTQF